MSGLSDDPSALMDATFGQLLRIEGLGTKSLLEIVCLTDTAIDIHEQTTAAIAEPTEAPGAGIPTSDSRGTPELHAVFAGVLQEPWAEQISEQDPRFARMLPSGRGTLEDRVERVLADPASASKEVSQLLASLPAIRQRVAAIQAMTLEDSLKDLLAAATRANGPRFDALVSRFGWAGEDPKTLQECGEQLGITRERVRQLERKVFERLPPHAAFLPKLDMAISLLEEASPIPVDTAATVVATHGISRRPFSPASVLDAARLLGRQTSLAIQSVRGQRMVASDAQGTRLGRTISVARALAGQSGVASVFQVIDRLAADSPSAMSLVGDALTEDDVRRILQRESACEFLNEDWFWVTDLPAGRNRLENLCKKMLCIASPQSIVSLREGVRRAFKYRASGSATYRTLVVPPAAVMTKFFQRHPDFRLEGELVAGLGLLSYRDLLGEGEKVITEVLRSISGGVLDRKTLTDSCAAQGLNQNTVSVYTTYSPILEHVGLDLWKLRGVQVDPAAVEAVRELNQLRPRENRLRDFGWSPEGKLWIAWRLPNSTTGLVLGIPGAVRRYLTNTTFQALTKDGERECGQIGINDGGTSYGYGRFLRTSGADEGDTLLAEFDLAGHQVALSLGDDTALEQS